MRFTSRNTLASYTTIISPLSELAGCKKNQSSTSSDSLCIGLESITVPTTYYNIPNQIDVYFNGVSYAGNIPITPGQYSIDEILTYLTSEMTTFDTPTYTYSQAPITLIWSIQSTVVSGYSLTFPAPLINYIQSAKSGNGGIVYSATTAPDIMDLGLIDMTRTRNYYIYCGQKPNMSYIADPISYDNILSKTELASNLLAVIPVNTDGLYIGKFFQNTRAGILNNRWDISLRDDYGEEIYCNGFEWTLNIFFQLMADCGTYF